MLWREVVGFSPGTCHVSSMGAETISPTPAPCLQQGPANNHQYQPAPTLRPATYVVIFFLNFYFIHMCFLAI
jgi:hypothetical protein